MYLWLNTHAHIRAVLWEKIMTGRRISSWIFPTSVASHVTQMHFSKLESDYGESIVVEGCSEIKMFAIHLVDPSKFTKLRAELRLLLPKVSPRQTDISILPPDHFIRQTVS